MAAKLRGLQFEEKAKTLRNLETFLVEIVEIVLETL
jgi:hypothetical protein